MAPERTITELLHAWGAGDRSAFDALVPILYEELRRIAARHLRNERADHTLRPTELVSEAYVRLVGSEHTPWTDRAHFFAIAARTMRQILVDHARRRGADKRGGGEQPLALEDERIAGGRSPDLLALDDALTALAAVDERKARVIELHYFGGLTQAEIGAALALHVTTVARDLRFAEAWIHSHLRGEPTD